MKLCSECKEPLDGILAFTEEGQEDFPWCFRCLDYVSYDGEQSNLNSDYDGLEARAPLASADLTSRVDTSNESN